MPYVIQTNHLTKTIGEKVIVKDVNLHVKKGEIYGFLGPNGAGKTTVMRKSDAGILRNIEKNGKHYRIPLLL